MNFWKNFEVLYRFTQKWIQPPACSDHGLFGHKPQSFPPNYDAKMPESQDLFFGLRLLSEYSNIQQSKPKYSSPLADFFNK
jgi:hypothetical protein